MDLGRDFLLKHYSISTGDIFRGPFAYDCSIHEAVVAFVDGDSVWLFPASSQEHTHNLFILRDPQAVIDIPAGMQTLFFPNVQRTSFVYCGKKKAQSQTLWDFI